MDSTSLATNRSMEALVSNRSIEWSSTGQRIVREPNLTVIEPNLLHTVFTKNTNEPNIPLSLSTKKSKLDDRNIQPINDHMDSPRMVVSSFFSPSTYTYSTDDSTTEPSTSLSAAAVVPLRYPSSITTKPVVHDSVPSSTTLASSIIGCSIPLYDIKRYITQKNTYSTKDLPLISTTETVPEDYEQKLIFTDRVLSDTDSYRNSVQNIQDDYHELVSPKVTIDEANILLAVLTSPHQNYPTNTSNNPSYDLASLLSTEYINNTTNQSSKTVHSFTDTLSTVAVTSSQSTASIIVPTNVTEFALRKNGTYYGTDENHRHDMDTSNDRTNVHLPVHRATDSTESYCSYVNIMGTTTPNLVTTPGTFDIFRSLQPYPENSSHFTSSSRTSILSLGTSTGSFILHNSDTHEPSKEHVIEDSEKIIPSIPLMDYENGHNGTDRASATNPLPRNNRTVTFTPPELVLSTEDTMRNHNVHYASHLLKHPVSAYDDTVNDTNPNRTVTSTNIPYPSLIVPEFSWNLLQYLVDNYNYTDEFPPLFGRPLVKIVPSMSNSSSIGNLPSTFPTIIVVGTDYVPDENILSHSSTGSNRTTKPLSHGLLCMMADITSRNTNSTINYSSPSTFYRDNNCSTNAPDVSSTTGWFPSSTFDFCPLRLTSVAIPRLVPYLEEKGWFLPSTYSSPSNDWDELSYIREMDWLAYPSSSTTVHSHTAILAMGRYLAKLSIVTENAITTEMEEMNDDSSLEDNDSDTTEPVSPAFRVTYEPLLIRQNTIGPSEYVTRKYSSAPVMHLASDDMRTLACSREYPGYTAAGGHDKLVTVYDLRYERILSFIPSKGVVSKVQWSTINPSILVWSNDESVLEYADIRCLSSASSGTVQKIRSSSLPSEQLGMKGMNNDEDNNHSIGNSALPDKASNPSISHACYTPTLGMYAFTVLNARLALTGYRNGYIDIIEPPSPGTVPERLSASNIPPATVYQHIRDPYVHSISDIVYNSYRNRIVCTGSNGFSVWKMITMNKNNSGNFQGSQNSSASGKPLPASTIECIGYSTVDSYYHTNGIPHRNNAYTQGTFFPFLFETPSSIGYPSPGTTVTLHTSFQRNYPESARTGLGYLTMDSNGYLNLYRL